MKKNKSFGAIRYLACTICCLPLWVFAQKVNQGGYNITGKIADSLSGKPVVYATISIWKDSINIASTYSAATGLFSIAVAQPGKYRLDISSVGYRSREMNVTLQEGQPVFQANLIYLVEGESYLKEVTIVSRKKLVEQKPGMLVYNAENDMSNKGGTAADVLRKAPALNVDAQGNVSMRGSSNLKILVDGKYSGQMARSPADALNMMPADIIKSVEVITTPSAKYDAEGAAGVINIITKKGRSNTSGTLEGSVSNWEQMLNPRFGVSGKKWSFSLSGHLHRLRSKSAASLERSTGKNGAVSTRLNQYMEKDNTAPHGSANLVINYTPDSVSELSIGINSWLGKWPANNRLSSTVSLPDGGIVEQYSQSVNGRTGYFGGDFHIGYSRKLRKQAQLTLLAQVSPSRDHSTYNAVQTDDDNTLLYTELNNSKTKNRELTFQGDYNRPLFRDGKVNLETGLKLIHRKVGNRYDVFASQSSVPGNLEPVASRSDYFKYSQDVAAVYLIVKVNLKNNWYIEGGSRLEGTFIKGSFLATATGFNNNFFNLVPTATISKKLNPENTLSISYTKRLTRPYIWDLNPNINASDPKNIESGNPDLKPEIAHQAELSYGLTANSSFFMNASLFWKQTDNAIIDFTSTDSTGVSFTSKQNLAANRQYGMNLSSSINVSSQWSVNGNVNINYLDFNSRQLEIFRKGWAIDGNLNTIYKLPRHFTVQAFGAYDSRLVSLQGYQTYRYHYSFAIKKDIPKRKLIFTLSTVNPFSKTVPQSEVIMSSSFISRTNNQYYNRALKLTVNWEFGGMFEMKERKKISNDDVNIQGKG